MYRIGTRVFKFGWELDGNFRFLEERHSADGTCPVMCGMNLRVVAELAFEALDAGVPADQLTPVWNAVDPASNLAGKLPGGRQRVERLRSPG